MASIPMDIEGDAFGKIYEYFLGRAPIGSNLAHQRLALTPRCDRTHHRPPIGETECPESGPG